jgi:uncharacterized protein YdcH (DUF465 family)
MNHDEVRDELIQTDKTFRNLYEEHRECEARLRELNEKTLLSAEEETQAKQIKVHKLHLKDRMESMIREHAAPTST